MNLNLPVENFKGIGPKTAEKLAKYGILTLGDLLYTFPRTYENYQAVSNIADIRPGKITIRGKVSNLSTRRARRRNLSITEGEISDETGSIRVVWFNQFYRAKQFDEQKEYYFQGLYDFKNGRYQLTSPVAALATDIDGKSSFQPIYVGHGELKPATFTRIFAKIRGELAFVPDLLPLSPENPDFVKSGMRAEALLNMHFPANPSEVEQGKKYLAYEELFELILAAELNKQENQKLCSLPLGFDQKSTKKFVDQLPFKLTNAQRRATWDILQDLEKSTPMNRLLQGDVGSGKTVVAALSAHQAISNGHQVALLAPTAILANQHAETLLKLLEPFGIKIALLTGATKNKAELKKQIENGNVDLVVGTHALLTDNTRFRSLALCIIDEQHRFGVEQRQKLLLKSPQGFAPHLLSMTATPIPRSLQLTIFGDLDVSIIDELPKGRQPIITKIIPEIEQKPNLYPAVHEILAKGQQVYWICPLIEEGGTSGYWGRSEATAEKEGASPVTTGASDPSPNNCCSVSAVKRQAKKLETIFPSYKIAILHGRMKPAEKDEVMTKFANHEIDILVSTTVVEVGVDVPNATAIVVMDAEKYGLAQLHQLRGRVGRGQSQSYCYLITPEDHRPSRRLRELEKSTDGFHLAEVDLELRGPGEIYGQLQHGTLNLRIANFADTKTIALASKYAKAFAKTPQNMLKYTELAHNIQKYQQLTTLN